MTPNREIKFRVWNGAEMVHDVTLGKFGVFYVNPSNNGLDPNDSASLTPFTTKYHEGTPVMQYTGLKDKNGVEIYEGDIVRILYTDWPSQTDHSIPLEEYKKSISQTGRVVFRTDFAEWSLEIWSPRYKEFANSTIHHGTHGEIEIIGNIYQNADLLKTEVHP